MVAKGVGCDNFVFMFCRWWRKNRGKREQARRGVIEASGKKCNLEKPFVEYF